MRVRIRTFRLLLTLCIFSYAILLWKSRRIVDEHTRCLPCSEKGQVADYDPMSSEICHFKCQILTKFRNSVANISKRVRMCEIPNTFNVNGDVMMKHDLKEQFDFVRNILDSHTLLSEMLNDIFIKTFIQNDEFFKDLNLHSYLPVKPLFDPKEKFASCGIVSNAGSMLGSKLGTHIDSNDFIIRFNDAPTTAEYSADVGSKTSLRIVNRLIVFKPEFKFWDPENELFENSPVLVWTLSGYNSTLDDWYRHWNLGFYEKFFSDGSSERREKSHLLHPQSTWSIWKYLQKHTKYRLRPYPSTSGFLGIVLALFSCCSVRVYEYIPSMTRYTNRIRYYGEEKSSDYGAVHPLAAEKLMAYALSTRNDEEIFHKGFLTIRGNCYNKE